MAVRLTPAVDSVQVWTCYSCYAIVKSVWSGVREVRYENGPANFEQRCGIKFCVKLGESATVTCENLQRAYGEHSLSRVRVFRWHKSFSEGREQVEDEPRAGRPSTAKTDNVERVRSLVRSDRRLTLRMIRSELNLNRFSVHQILTQDLDMRKVCAKMVPKNLMTQQKANRRDVDLLEREPEFFSRVITGVNNGFWSTTPRKKAKVGSGTLQTLPVPRKRDWANPKSNRCSFVFLTVRGSPTRNLCHQDKLSIRLFIGKSLKDSGKGWHVCDQALYALGCCTTTAPHVTRQSPSMNLWQKKTFL